MSGSGAGRGVKPPSEQKPKGRRWLNDGSCIRLRHTHPNHVWSYDYVHHATHDGRSLRLLTLIDEHTRQSLATGVRRRFSGSEVIEVLFDAMLSHGIPEYIRSDNGPEMTSELVRHWLRQVGSQTLFIEPGSRRENGYNESSDGKLQDELLNGEIFYSLKEARSLSNDGHDTTSPKDLIRRSDTGHRSRWLITPRQYQPPCQHQCCKLRTLSQRLD